MGTAPAKRPRQRIAKEPCRAGRLGGARRRRPVGARRAVQAPARHLPQPDDPGRVLRHRRAPHSNDCQRADAVNVADQPGRDSISETSPTDDSWPKPGSIWSGGAGGAEAEDLQRVMNVAEAVLGADLVGPALDGRSFDLDGPPAASADQVMVVAVAAPPVDSFTVAGPHHVDSAVGRHGLEGAVHRGESYALALGTQPRVQVLGRHEVADVHEQGFDGGSLSGGPTVCYRHQCLTDSSWVLSGSCSS